MRSLTRIDALLVLIAAGWPVWRWFAARLHNGTDEPFGLIALVAALWFAPRDGWREALTSRRLWVLCGGLALYIAGLCFLPALVRAFLMVGLFGVVLTRDRFPVAWAALLALSLPVVATAQFYLGYPLRLATAFFSSYLLKICGLLVAADGTSLRYAGERIVVDAPCSGIHMGWTGLLLACVIACWHGLGNRSTLRLLQLAGIIVFCANVLRSTALFCLESNLWPRLPGDHEGVGLIAFGAAAIGIFLIADRMAASAHDRPGPVAAPRPRFSVSRLPGYFRARLANLSLGGAAASGFMVLATLAILAPLLPSQPSRAGLHSARFPGWADAPIPARLAPCELSARELRFRDRFPGEMAAFTDGHRLWLVRWVAHPTRQLHPASDCLRAFGYDVQPKPLLRESTGEFWGTCSATRAGERLRVKERIVDARGRQFTDVSSWYWAAAFGGSIGPWWSITEWEGT